MAEAQALEEDQRVGRLVGEEPDSVEGIKEEIGTITRTAREHARAHTPDRLPVEDVLPLTTRDRDRPSEDEEYAGTALTIMNEVTEDVAQVTTVTAVVLEVEDIVENVVGIRMLHVKGVLSCRCGCGLSISESLGAMSIAVKGVKIVVNGCGRSTYHLLTAGWTEYSIFGALFLMDTDA